ncbi:MAG: peptidoglycan D,D-transpeptidase FtsI family protein [Clostridia bacterium]
MDNKKKPTSKKISKSSPKNKRISKKKQPIKKEIPKKVPSNKKENLTLLSNKEKIKKENKTQSQTKSVPTKRLLKGLVCAGVLLVCLVVRIGYIQFVQGTQLKESANRQQTTNRIINAKRGTIYDSTGKALATSARVDTVTINPERIKEENKETVAKAFSDIFTLDYNETLEKVKSTSSIETIAKKVEQDKIDQLKTWMKDNKMYAGINIDEDVKRYYPYSNLASNLIGFCGTDNQGLEGLELKWDNILTGVPGKIITTKDAVEEFIPDKNETYIAAQNGSNITLSLDVNIQSIVEKYLKQAVIENDCKRGGTAIVMKPSTGDILAMASYPDYDLNTPYEPNDSMKSTWDTLSSSEKSNSLYTMWRNRCVSDTYEPGSTFKLANFGEGLFQLHC